MKLEAWQTFILQNGWRANGHHLAHILGRDVADVEAVRRRYPQRKLRKSLGFAEIFSRWKGRAPVDADWPTPRKVYGGGYEWLLPELTFLASIVGTMGKPEMAAVLTARLRKITGDPKAERNVVAVQSSISRLGLQVSDVVGGITVLQAGREIGSMNIVYQAIGSTTTRPSLRHFRVGRNLVIPHEEWARWKAARTLPPKGFVQLSSIREPLGLSSDSKLPEYASCGYIPTAILCSNPHQPRVHSTGRGSWYVDAKVARALVRDRRAGRPMPWHGKPLRDNMKKTFALWQKRKHPAECKDCRAVWGKAGEPRDFDEYMRRYAELDFTAKKHLTRVWSSTMTIGEAATHAGVRYERARRAVDGGTLHHEIIAGVVRISRTEANRWKHRGCPTGSNPTSWLSLGLARRLYGYSFSEMRRMIAAQKLKSRIGVDGAERGLLYVSKAQLAMLREREGFTLSHAAKRVGISPAKMTRLLKEHEWREASGIPLIVVNTIKDRLVAAKREGVSIETAAALCRAPVSWVQAQVRAGVIRLWRSTNDRRVTYVTPPMLRRLREAHAKKRLPRDRLGPLWLNLSEAALDASVSITTVRRWVEDGELKTRTVPLGPRVHRRAVRKRAREHWQTCNKKRGIPAWLKVSTSTLHA